jgi:hypothetical protein
MARFQKALNEYGRAQMYDEDGNEVCAVCHALMMPNQGEGMACEDCRADALAEMSLDPMYANE